MYNRYIPRADGTYQRSRLPETVPPPAHPGPPPPPEAPAPQPPAFHPPPPRSRPRQPRREPEKTGSIGTFFRQLLPVELDTADLLVVLLLLLISGDCQEEQNTALLTLALYLFL